MTIMHGRGSQVRRSRPGDGRALACHLMAQAGMAWAPWTITTVLSPAGPGHGDRPGPVPRRHLVPSALGGAAIAGALARPAAREH